MQSFRPIPSSPVLRRDHPLAKALWLYAVAGPGYWLSLSRRPNTLTNSVLTAIGSPYGSVARSNGSSGSHVVTDISPNGLFPSAMSCAFLARRDSTSSGEQYMLGADGGLGRPLFQIGSFRNSPRVFFRSGNSLAVTFGSWPSGYTLIAGTGSAAGTRAYQDGQLAGQNLGSFTGGAIGGLDNLPIGARRETSSIGRHFPGDGAMAAIWSRPLSADEHAQLASDPFAVIRPRSRLITYGASLAPAVVSSVRRRLRW